jgi:hypothetical protein
MLASLKGMFKELFYIKLECLLDSPPVPTYRSPFSVLFSDSVDFREHNKYISHTATIRNHGFAKKNGVENEKT